MQHPSYGINFFTLSVLHSPTLQSLLLFILMLESYVVKLPTYFVVSFCLLFSAKKLFFKSFLEVFGTFITSKCDRLSQPAGFQARYRNSHSYLL